jgi:hypothetical protein
MTLPRLVCFLVAFACLGCSPKPRVRSQATPGTDFTKYHTYAIKPGNVAYPGAPESQRTEIAKRIQDAVAMELESRGLEPQPDEPDLVVTYTAGARQGGGAAVGVRAAEGVDAREPGGNPYDEPGALRAQELPDAAADAELRSHYLEGSLVIDLLDGKTRRLVWRATANLELASDRGGKLIGPTVKKAFADVPLSARSAQSPSTRP